jgi:hypothetical protein
VTVGGWNTSPEAMTVDSSCSSVNPEFEWRVGDFGCRRRMPGPARNSPRSCAYLRDRIEHYKVPRSFDFADDLPRTPPASWSTANSANATCEA